MHWFERVLFYLQSIKVDYLLSKDQVLDQVDPARKLWQKTELIGIIILHYIFNSLFDLYRALNLLDKYGQRLEVRYFRCWKEEIHC